VSAPRINRRSFVAGSAALVSVPSLAMARPSSRVDARLGFSTVSIRDRLPFRLPGAPPPAPGAMRLLDAPRFAADTIGLRNLEVWNLQFEDVSDDYCRQLRAAANRARVGIVNVQVDSRMDLGSEDGDERERSVAEAIAWIDRAALIGSRAVRFNFSPISPKRPFAVGPVAGSFRTLARYGRRKRVMVLTENHIGHAVPVANVAAVLRAVDHPNLRTIYDWGNVPDATTDRVIEQVAVLAPWLYQVSAKGVAFDADYRMTSYDVAAITRATERLGFRGLYSVELFGPTPAGFDPVRGIAAMRTAITAGLARSHR
jgi:sugar phosphate isomerase/epimerase